ncbi:MAG: TDP-N-acetylfucosamine:lipid II N-acetylfucosaminyltransferase [Desulfatiglans sp.]|nr:TDP-N-acetylfucosamine:lipid II N-acetylfucosaminyltransferase [Desulfatiglans sp.]
MKLLHFIPDSPFSVYIKDTFDRVFPDSNIYRTHTLRGDSPAFLEKSPDVEFAGIDYWTSRRMREEVKQCDCLIINSMNPLYIDAILGAPSNVVIFWATWGGDYYRFLSPYMTDIHLPKTRILLEARKGREFIRYWINRMMTAIKDPLKIRSYLGVFLPYLSWRKKLPLDVIPRIDYFHVLPTVRNLFEMAFPGANKQYNEMFFFCAEKTFSAGPTSMNGPDILIGNGATPANNHLEIFDLLDDLDLGSRKLIVPLNRGDKRYAKEIEIIGKRRFGERITILRDLMPASQYYQCIQKCGTVIMNHVRHAAGATIPTVMYKGSRVYLRNENPLKNFYENLGVPVGSVQDDLAERKKFLKPFCDTEKIQIHKVLEARWSDANALQSIGRLADFVKERHSLCR